MFSVTLHALPLTELSVPWGQGGGRGERRAVGMLGGRDASRLSAASAKAQKRIFPSPFLRKVLDISSSPLPFPSQNFLLVNSPPCCKRGRAKAHTHSLAPSIFHTLHGSIHPPPAAFLPLPCDTLFVIQTFFSLPFFPSLRGTSPCPQATDLLRASKFSKRWGTSEADLYLKKSHLYY